MTPIVVFERETLRVVSNADALTCVDTARADSGAGTDTRPCIAESVATALEWINSVRPGFCQRVVTGIQLSQHCGIVRLPNGRLLEILPKIWSAQPREKLSRSAEIARARMALLHMLAKSQDMNLSELESAAQETVRVPLLDLFVRVFLRGVLAVAKYGLMSRYVETVGDLTALRGRLLFAENQLRAAARPGLVRCVHDEFTANNRYNQALLAAIEACRASSRTSSTQRLWLEARAFFDGIARARFDGDRIRKLPRNRATRRYEESLKWAEIILDLLSPSLSAGSARAPTLLFDMEKLFERWVEVHESAHALEGLVARRHRSSRYLASVHAGPPTRIDHTLRPASTTDEVGAAELGHRAFAFRLTPDVLVWRRDLETRTEAPEVIVDAKWKPVDPRLNDWGVSESDVYQLLAYMTRFGCKRAKLVYPMLLSPAQADAGPQPPKFRIQLGTSAMATIEIGLVPIDV